jgi:hypothetical protein
VVAGFDVACNRGQVGKGLFQARQQVAQLAGAQQRMLDLEQVRRHQHDAAFGAIEQGAQVVHAAEVDVVLLLRSSWASAVCASHSRTVTRSSLGNNEPASAAPPLKAQ